jgi:hypothetical protein
MSTSMKKNSDTSAADIATATTNENGSENEHTTGITTMTRTKTVKTVLVMGWTGAMGITIVTAQMSTDILAWARAAAMTVGNIIVVAAAMTTTPTLTPTTATEATTTISSHPAHFRGDRARCLVPELKKKLSLTRSPTRI